jgi:hypothetical protein
MTLLSRRLIQFAALVAASFALGRPSVGLTAQACASCTSTTKCEDTHGGVSACSIINNSCEQTNQVCGGS